MINSTFEIISEFGYEEALYGLGLSHGKTSDISFEEFVTDRYDKDSAFQRMEKVATSLAGRGDGHDKFLRMIQITIKIKMPLRMWKQFDTYKIGTTTQSESTMHTLLKTPITLDLFSMEGYDYRGAYKEHFDGYLQMLEVLRQSKQFEALNNALPQSFYQTRIVQLNYEVLRNICKQRKNHKQKEWDAILHAMEWQCRYKHLLRERG